MLANDFGDANFDDLELIDRVCDEFESNWKAERNPEISEYLSRLHESYQRTLFKELVRTDVFYRKKQGKLLTFSEYATTWPDLLDALYELESELQFENFPVVPDYFKLGDLIGEGSFGFVHKARDTRHDRWVAIKTPRHRVLSAEERKQYLHEIKTVASLDHPNVVKIYESGESTTGPYVVYEFVNGRSLAELTSRQKFSVQEASEIVLQILEILEYVHQQGVLHRDLKPANLILDAGTVKLIDFGLAKRCGNESTLNSGHKFLGTFAYASPEQIGGETKELQPASDLYSVGVIFYQLLKNCSPTDWIKQKEGLQGRFSLPERKGYSEYLKIIIQKATARDPKDRYQSAAEFRAAIVEALRIGNSIFARENLFGLIRSNRRQILAASFVLTFVALGYGAFQRFGRLSETTKFRQTVTLSTEPVKSIVHYFPIDPNNGEPVLSEGVTTFSGSEYDVSLEAGDYLVVAIPANDAGQEAYAFHEVYRHVPAQDEGNLDNPTYRHLKWANLENGKIELPSIQLPKLEKLTERMAYLRSVPLAEESSRPELGKRPVVDDGIFVDFGETTIDELKKMWPDLRPSPLVVARKSSMLSPDYPVSAASWDDAVAYAEAAGKRLPTKSEYLFVATGGGKRDFPWSSDAMASDEWEVGEVGCASWDTLVEDNRVVGLCSNVGEWTSSIEGGVEKRVIVGAPGEFIQKGLSYRNPGFTPEQTSSLLAHGWENFGLGFRCYRSKNPRQPMLSGNATNINRIGIE